MAGKGAVRISDAVSHGSASASSGAAGTAAASAAGKSKSGAKGKKHGKGSAHAAKASEKQSRADRLKAAVDHPPSQDAAERRAAFLQTIRVFEGTAGENGARTMYGGKLAPNLDDHPREAAAASFEMGGKTYTTHAAGAYQFQPGTWDTYKKDLDLADFSQASQDRAALADIADKKDGALLDAIDRGDVDTAATGLHKEWTSLPGGPQARGSTADFEEAYGLALEGNPVESLSQLPSRRLPKLERLAEKAEAKAKEAEAKAAAAGSAAKAKPNPKNQAAAEKAGKKATAARAKADAAKKEAFDAKAHRPPPPPEPAEEKEHAPLGAVARAAQKGAGGATASGGPGVVQEGSPNVNVEGQPAARAGVDHTKCDKHPPKLISEGSDSVFVNGKPFARLSDLTECGAVTMSSSSTVIVGGGTTTVADVAGNGAGGGGPAHLGVLPQGGVARAAAVGRVIGGVADGSSLHADDSAEPVTGTAAAARQGGAPANQER